MPSNSTPSLAPASSPRRVGMSGRALVHVPCNLCGHEVTRGVHNVSRVVRCVSCELIFVNPRPPFEELAKQYERTYFHCPEPTFGGYEDYEADREEIMRTFRKRMKRLAPHLSGNPPRLLDVGCATGIFLEVAREAAWQAEGIDISEYALARARAKGLSVQRGADPGAVCPADAFDVITMWDLIEHVLDPAALLAECHDLLRPGGVLAISTPDAGSFLAHVLRGNWLGFRSVDEHLYFFSRATITRMLEEAGFEVLRFERVGKYFRLPRLIDRMRFYSKIAARVLRTANRLVPRVSIYVNSYDTMYVLASRKLT